MWACERYLSVGSVERSFFSRRAHHARALAGRSNEQLGSPSEFLLPVLVGGVLREAGEMEREDGTVVPPAFDILTNSHTHISCI